MAYTHATRPYMARQCHLIIFGQHIEHPLVLDVPLLPTPPPPWQDRLCLARHWTWFFFCPEPCMGWQLKRETEKNERVALNNRKTLLFTSNQYAAHFLLTPLISSLNAYLSWTTLFALLVLIISSSRDLSVHCTALSHELCRRFE